MDYQLEVQFQLDDSRLLYQGEIGYFRDYTDQLTIKENSILINFSRAKKISPDNILFSERSVFRLYIQKALAFLLAVKGNIPTVLSVYLRDKNGEYPIKHDHFSNTWTNCNCSIQFSSEEIKIIFQKTDIANAAYIALTYWLKSQLDSFPNDQIRALWSGFNGIYSYYGKNLKQKHEKDKLNNILDNYLQVDDFPLSIDYCRSYSDEILKSISWYPFADNVSKKRIKELVQTYRDQNIQQRLLTFGEVVAKEKNIKMNGVNDFICCSETNYAMQFRFLIIEYAYFLRNQYFHAEKAYPLFIISDIGKRSSDDHIIQLMKIALPEMISQMIREPLANR